MTLDNLDTLTSGKN